MYTVGSIEGEGLSGRMLTNDCDDERGQRR
jgi:hypothetical protein